MTHTAEQARQDIAEENQKAEDAQILIEQWCYDHLPEAFQNCLKKPELMRDGGGSILAHIHVNKREEWLSLLKLTGLYRAEVEFAGETQVIAAGGWCDCERVWEYINKADAKHTMLEEMLDA